MIETDDQGKREKKEKEKGSAQGVLGGNDDKKRVSLAWAKRMFQSVVIVDGK